MEGRRREMPGGQLNIRATILYAILWSAITLATGWDLSVGDPVSRLTYPAGSTIRLANRELARVDAAAASDERWLWRPLLGTPDEVATRTEEALREAVLHLEARRAGGEEALRRARAHWAVLIAQRGELDDALAVVADDPTMAAALAAIYRGAPTSADVDAFLESGLDGWIQQQLARQAAVRSGDPALASRIEAASRGLGERWLDRTRALLLSEAALVLAGILALALWAGRATRSATPSTGAPWPFADGIGVLVRGDFWFRAYYWVAVEFAPEAGSSFASEAGSGFAPEAGSGFLLEAGSSFLGFLLQIGAPLAAAPLIWLTYRHLLRPLGGNSIEVLGLRPSALPGGIARLAGLAMIAVSVDLAGAFALSHGAWHLGLEGHFSEGLDEILIWGSRAEALARGIDYVAWTPFIEELSFRGLLYFTLRSRLSPIAAAAASASVFGALHFYSLAGFASALWSGLVWAWVFEQSRSLWPSILSHAIYNALFVATLLALYR